MLNKTLILALLSGLLSAPAALLAEETPFYLTLDPPPAPELEPNEAFAAFTLAAGFKIELVAAEPLVEDPVGLKWDEHGNAYVIEMRGFMPDAYGNGEDEPVGRVVRLTDTNGNGVFDQRKVMLDKLVLPRAIAVVNEGLLIAEPPTLWLCPSETGYSRDISCANKVALGNYGDQPGSVEHAENGLLLGLDNWLYNAKSKRRMRLVEGRLEAEATRFRGQWGIAQDRAGRLFYNTNSTLLQADAYDAQVIVAAGNRGAPGLGVQVSGNDGVFAVRVNPGVNRAYVPGVLRNDGRLNRPTSASGMTLDRGGWLGGDGDRQVFVAEPAANAVVQLQLKYDGLNISSEHMLYPHPNWQQVEFLASTDERFRPVDVTIGPDGALYVVDMYRGIIQDHVFLTDELRAQALARGLDKPVGRGRIWRVVPTNVTPSMPEDLGALSARQLIDRLGNKNGWQRETAQRLLINKSERGLKRYLAKTVGRGSALQAVHALWTLSGRGELERKVVLQGLARSEPEVRRAALRAGAEKLKRADLLALEISAAEVLLRQEHLLQMSLHNSDPQVHQYLMRALFDNFQDDFVPSAVQAATQGWEVSFLKALLATGDWTSVQESKTGFVKQLAVQAFTTDRATATDILDLVEMNADSSPQLAAAMLDGLFEVTRIQGFERAVLTAEHSIFNSSRTELWAALTRARRAVTWPGDTLVAGAKPLTPPEQRRMQLGQAYFQSHCATCHGADGRGIAALAPSLVDSAWVTGPTEILAQVTLAGLQGPISVGEEVWNGVMPGHSEIDEFTDEVAAGLLTYLHRAWGHTGRAVGTGFVAEQRTIAREHGTLWTAAALAQIPVNTHYRRYQGRYGRSGFGFEFVYLNGELVVQSAIFNGPLTERKEDFFFFEPRALNLEFVYTDDGQVRGVRMLTDDGGVVLPRIGSAAQDERDEQ